MEGTVTAGNRYGVKKQNKTTKPNPEQRFACKEENAGSCITRRGGTNTGRKACADKNEQRRQASTTRHGRNLNKCDTIITVRSEHTGGKSCQEGLKAQTCKAQTQWRTASHTQLL